VKPIRRKSRLATILLFPFLAIAFLIGFIASVCGERKEQRFKPKNAQKQRNQKSTDNITLEFMPQEKPQTH
jgi:hypothetical protein